MREALSMEEQINRSFKVIDKETNQEVKDAFILLPVHDFAARIALATYAEATNNSKIARWVRAWLREIRIAREQAKRDGSSYSS